MTHAILLLVVGLVGGALGSMVGLGGGVFMVPAMALFLDVPIHEAVAASLLGVVATSATTTVVYLSEGLTNIRLGMTMETLTVTGALVGGLVGAMLSRVLLSAVFGGAMMVVVIYLSVRTNSGNSADDAAGQGGALGAVYYDRNLKRVVGYRVRRLPVGLGASFVAGGASGLLGVGGGFLTVPAMVVAMEVPIRAAVSTNSFTIGVTASAAALVYLAQGFVDLFTTAPVVLGVVVGAYLGSWVARRAKSSVVTRILAVVLFALAVQMILAAFGISVR